MARKIPPNEAIYKNYIVGKGTPCEVETFCVLMEEHEYNIDEILRLYALMNDNEKSMFENAKRVQNGDVKGLKLHHKRFRLDFDKLDSVTRSVSDYDWQELFATFTSKQSAINYYNKIKNETVRVGYEQQEVMQYRNFVLIDTKTGVREEL